MAMVAAKCTMCGSSIKVDDSKEKGICEHCGTEFITEKVINVTNITNVDKSTNIYYGETTDAKIKKDLEKAYKSLKMAGYDYINLKMEDNSLDEELCRSAYTLAKGVTKKDPTNYDGWRCLALMHYVAYMEDEYEWLYGKNTGEGDYNFDRILDDTINAIYTATKVAPNDEEKAFLKKLKENVKINYYQEKLYKGRSVAQYVNYTEKPKIKEVLLSRALPWIGGWIVAMGLLLLINNLFKLNISFIPEDTPTVMAIMLLVTGGILIGIFLYKYIGAKRNQKQRKDIDDDNKKRYNEKQAEYENDIANAKTLVDWERLAAKYNIDKI